MKLDHTYMLDRPYDKLKIHDEPEKVVTYAVYVSG